MYTCIDISIYALPCCAMYICSRYVHIVVVHLHHRRWRVRADCEPDGRGPAPALISLPPPSPPRAELKPGAKGNTGTSVGRSDFRAFIASTTLQPAAA